MTTKTTLAPVAVQNGNGTSHHRNSAPSPNNEWQIAHVPVGNIVPSPFQPRERFDAAELEELAGSIKAYGVQQPILVRPLQTENGKKDKARFELVAGERRWRASQLAGKKTIPTIVRELSDLAAAEIAVIENVQRANLSVIEEARGYKCLAIDFRLKEERIAKKVGKSVATIKEMLRLLQLPESVQTLLAKRQLSAAHGHELLRLAPHPKICESVALRCVSDKITAASLAANLLPNAQELKRAGLITEVGFATKFDWRSVCKECPHKALVSSGYSSFCLRPDEWKRKQNEAVEVQKQEAVRVMEEAREQNGGAVEVEKLAPGSYRRLQSAHLPVGCSESCACRNETCDSFNPTKRIPVCLNPDRFQELQDAERRAHEEARKRRYTQEWSEAIEKLKSDGQGDALTAALLVWPVLRGEGRPYVQPEAWRAFVQSIAAHLEIEEPLDALFDRETSVPDGLKRLQAIPSKQLLRLGASVILGTEAQTAVRFAGETPQLDAVLGRETALQTEFDPDGEPDHLDEEFAEEPYDDCDVDYPDEMEE